MEENKEYYAFISYKREDKKEARRLQHALEYYRLPNHLRQDNPELPEYVRPVFRDMTDLEVGELSAQIHSALEQSHFLIVVCSPRAAASKWVNDEVEYFISLGKHDNIIPYIIEGIPHANNPNEECYPPALLRLSKEKELLGANINEVGKDSATIRVVSRMFNIRFDTLYQRYQREQKRRRLQRTTAIVLSFLFLLVVACWIWYQNVLLKERERKMMENQARAVAEKSKQEVANGNVKDALLALLEIFPSKNNKWPYAPEVDEAMRIALRSLQYGGYNYQKIGSNIHYFIFPRNGDIFISIYKNGMVEVYTKKELNATNSFRITREDDEKIYLYETYLSKDNRRLMVVDSSYIKIYDTSNGQLLDNIPLDKIGNNKYRTLVKEFTDVENTVHGHFFTKAIDEKCLSYNASTHIALCYYELQHFGEEPDTPLMGYYALVNIESNNVLYRKNDYFPWEGPYNISDIELSPNGETLAIAYYSGEVEEYNIRKKLSKKWKNMSNDYSEHYSNQISYSYNGNLLFQTSAFQNTINIINTQNMTLMDSINIWDTKGNVWDPEGAYVCAEGNGHEILCLLKNNLYIYDKGDNEISNADSDDSLTIDRSNHCIHDWKNKKDYYYSTTIGSGRNSEDIIKGIKNNKNILITTESDGISLKDLNNPNISWKHTNILESECMGYTSDYKYLFILDNGYRGSDRLLILEMNTGKIVYEPNGEYFYNVFYYSESDGLLFFEDYNGNWFTEPFPMYQKLAESCRKWVKGMHLTSQKKYDFFLD